MSDNDRYLDGYDDCLRYCAEIFAVSNNRRDISNDNVISKLICGIEECLDIMCDGIPEATELSNRLGCLLNLVKQLRNGIK